MTQPHEEEVREVAAMLKTMKQQLPKAMLGPSCKRYLSKFSVAIATDALVLAHQEETQCSK